MYFDTSPLKASLLGTKPVSASPIFPTGDNPTNNDLIDSAKSLDAAKAMYNTPLDQSKTPFFASNAKIIYPGIEEVMTTTGIYEGNEADVFFSKERRVFYQISSSQLLASDMISDKGYVLLMT